MTRPAIFLAAALIVVIAGGLTAGVTKAATSAGFPAGYEDYTTYAEMEARLDAAVAAHGQGSNAIVRKFSIGRSFEGREIWAAKVSDRVALDEDEPEILFESLAHAREHLTVEMNLYVLDLLTDGYGHNSRITRLVNTRELYLVFMLNPDGGEYDISGSEFKNWRRNRQPIPDTTSLGVDLNRNWGFKWGCCGGSSGKPGTTTYRGPAPWYAPEVVALRDFVDSRVVNGRQQIRSAISWHAFNEEIMWPYGYTQADVPRTMSADDHRALRALGTAMAGLNGYTAQQLSDLYLVDGGASDWLYNAHRIFAYTIEMYPTENSAVGGFYPPADVIATQTSRNRDMVLHFLEQADCPYRDAGLATTHCGPLNDDFETARGWLVDPFGTDDATSGEWQRGVPDKTRNRAGIKQLRVVPSGMAAVATGLASGGSVQANDVDGGVTSILSPSLSLAGSGDGWTLSLRYSFAHNAKAGTVDWLRVSVRAGSATTPLWTLTGNGANRNAAWQSLTLDLDAWAGQKVRLLVEARDGVGDSLVEAAIDDVRVYRAP